MPGAVAVGSEGGEATVLWRQPPHHQAATLPHIVPTQRANVKLMKMKTSTEAASNLDGDSVYHPDAFNSFHFDPRVDIRVNFISRIHYTF